MKFTIVLHLLWQQAKLTCVLPKQESGRQAWVQRCIVGFSLLGEVILNGFTTFTLTDMMALNAHMHTADA